MADTEVDRYRVLGMFNETGEKLDWISRAPRLSSLHGMSIPHADLRGFIKSYKKNLKLYIVAVKVHCRGCDPERVEFFTGWGLIGQREGGFPLISENVPREVKSAANVYLLDWLGWFKGKKATREMITQQEIEWRELPTDDPVDRETEDYFNMRFSARAS